MVTDFFGDFIKYDLWDKQGNLPLHMLSRYKFKLAYIFDIKCIVIRVIDKMDTLPAIKKHIAKIKEIENIPVVLELNNISFYRKKSLLKNMIPFITEKNIFLPFMYTMITSENEDTQEVEKFVYSTQQLLLLYFYTNEKKMYVSELSKKFPFTAMTLTRAVKQLEATNLFCVTKDGVNKIIEAKCERLELFEKIRKYMINPIRKSAYIEKTQVTNDMVLSGETALANKTMLNQSKLVTYAVYEKNFDKKIIQEDLIDPNKQVRVELWAYDPLLFTKDDMVDSISLALSFEKNEDERIEQAIEEMTESELR